MTKEKKPTPNKFEIGDYAKNSLLSFSGYIIKKEKCSYRQLHREKCQYCNGYSGSILPDDWKISHHWCLGYGGAFTIIHLEEENG